jgi:molybdopterin converting factor small subunit
MPIVHIPSLLRSSTGGQERLTAAGATVGELIEHLEQAYPGIKARLCQGQRLRPELTLVVDGAVSRRGLAQKLDESSEVRFLPAISGGSPAETRMAA